MASIYDLKSKFQNLLRPLLNFLFRNKVTPNTVTLTAFAGSAAVGFIIVLFAENSAVLFILPIWLFVRMALNAIDGMLARDYKLSSTFGAVLNEVGDILSDMFIYLPLAAAYPPAMFAVITFVAGAILTEFVGVLMQALGTKRHYEGPMGKSDRAFSVGLIALIGAIWPQTCFFWSSVFWAGAFLTIWTCVNRARGGLAGIRTGVI